MNCRNVDAAVVLDNPVMPVPGAVIDASILRPCSRRTRLLAKTKIYKFFLMHFFLGIRKSSFLHKQKQRVRWK